MDKLRQKLQRAYLRRDHYAQLYYQTKSELEETKWQLSIALNKIKQMQSQSKQECLSMISILIPSGIEYNAFVKRGYTLVLCVFLHCMCALLS